MESIKQTLLRGCDPGTSYVNHVLLEISTRWHAWSLRQTRIILSELMLKVQILECLFLGSPWRSGPGVIHACSAEASCISCHKSHLSFLERWTPDAVMQGVNSVPFSISGLFRVHFRVLFRTLFRTRIFGTLRSWDILVICSCLSPFQKSFWGSFWGLFWGPF